MGCVWKGAAHYVAPEGRDDMEFRLNSSKYTLMRYNPSNAARKIYVSHIAFSKSSHWPAAKRSAAKKI